MLGEFLVSVPLAIQVLLLIAAVHGDDKTGLLRVRAVLYLLFVHVVQALDELACLLLICLHLSSVSLAGVLVVRVHLFALALDLVSNLLVDLQLAISFSLGLTALSHQHLPPTHVIHCLVLVRQKVPLNKRTVAHCDSPTASLQRSFLADVGQSHL